MLKIAICDDEKIVAGQIEESIWKVCKKENIVVETDVFFNGDELKREVYNGSRYDII